MHNSKKNPNHPCQVVFSGEPSNMPINLYLCQSVISYKIRYITGKIFLTLIHS